MKHFEKQRQRKKFIALFKSIMTVSVIFVVTFGALFFVTNIVEHFIGRTTASAPLPPAHPLSVFSQFQQQQPVQSPPKTTTSASTSASTAASWTPPTLPPPPAVPASLHPLPAIPSPPANPPPPVIPPPPQQQQQQQQQQHLAPISIDEAIAQLEAELKKKWRTGTSFKSIMEKAITFTGFLSSSELAELKSLKQTQSELMKIEDERKEEDTAEETGKGKKIRHLNHAIKQYQEATEYYQNHRNDKKAAIIQYAATSALAVSTLMRASGTSGSSSLPKSAQKNRQQQLHQTKEMAKLAQGLYFDVKHGETIAAEKKEQALKSEFEELKKLFLQAIIGAAQDTEGKSIKFQDDDIPPPQPFTSTPPRAADADDDNNATHSLPNGPLDQYA